MTLIVQKYGGTSVGSVERISAVAKRVARCCQEQQVVVVVSAMAGETDRLIQLCNAMGGATNDAQRDAVISAGEQISAGLLALALGRIGIEAQCISGDLIGIHTDAAHGKARILDVQPRALQSMLADGIVPVVPGFQGRTPDNKVSTLGRGGSDTTAVALASALAARECQIYTDVDGIYTTDPRVCKNARLLPTIFFEEMLEMASLGSKILQLRSVEFAGKYRVPLRVLSSMTDNNACGGGTLITYEEENMEKPIVSGIAINRLEAKITVAGVPDKPGIAHQLLSVIAAANINVDIIVQNVGSAGQTDFSFTVPSDEFMMAMEQTKQAALAIDAKNVLGDDTIGKLSVVGIGMKSHTGVASKMFRVLAENDINIQMIATSEIRISVIIEEKHLETAVCALHDAFGLDTIPME